MNKYKHFSNTTLLIFISTILLAQGNIKYNISLLSKAKKPIPGVIIHAIETNSLTEVKGVTKEDGSARLSLNNGDEWAISIGKMKNYLYMTAQPQQIISIDDQVMYDLADYQRKQEQDPSRDDSNYTVIKQTIGLSDPFQEPNCLLSIHMTDPFGTILQGRDIRVVNDRDQIVYQGTTDAKGIVNFILPNKSKYDIDVDGYKNYTYHDLGEEYSRRNMFLKYSPTLVKETIVRDTVYQHIDSRTKPSSKRGLVTLEVTGGVKNGVGEKVYVKDIQSGKVYASVSDQNRFAKFLLPVKKIYLIDFMYQKDVDAIDLSRAGEMTTYSRNVHYSLDMRLKSPEDFIPMPDMLLLHDFNQMLTKTFERPREVPVLLKFVNVFKINKKSKEAVIRLALTTPDQSYEYFRAPLNISLVLDKSGSMYSEGRDVALRKALWAVGNAFSESDIVSVVLFESRAIEAQYSFDHHLEDLQRVIEYYKPLGGTNIYQGLQKGEEIVKRNISIDKENKILLLTDGYGITPPMEMSKYVAGLASEGIEVSAIGLGESFNQSLLQLLAQNGHGNFSYVDHDTDLSSVFLEEVQNTYSKIAKDLKIEVFHHENLIFSQLLGFPAQQENDTSFSINIRKLSLDQTKIAFLKFKLNNPTTEIEQQPLTVRVSYEDLKTGKKVQYEEEIFLEWTDDEEEKIQLDNEERKLYAVAVLNQTLKLMAEHYEAMAHDKALFALEDGKRQISEIYPDAKPKEVKELFEDVDEYLVLFRRIESNR